MFFGSRGYVPAMSATEVVEQIKSLPTLEKSKVIDWLFSEESELDAVFDAFDKMPRRVRLTEDEILALPRNRSALISTGL